MKISIFSQTEQNRKNTSFTALELQFSGIPENFKYTGNIIQLKFSKKIQDIFQKTSFFCNVSISLIKKILQSTAGKQQLLTNGANSREY